MGSRVNSSTIFASSNAATPYTVSIGVAAQIGDLIVVAAESNGTHVSNGMVVQDSVNLTNFSTIVEEDTSNGGSRWLQAFSFVTPVDLLSSTTLTFTPYAASALNSFSVDIFRGYSSTQVVTATVANSPGPATSTPGAAFASAPSGGSLVLSFIGALTAPTIATPYTQGSSGSTNASTGIGYVLSADGTSTYSGPWSIASSNTWAVIDAAFARSADPGFSFGMMRIPNKFVGPQALRFEFHRPNYPFTTELLIPDPTVAWYPLQFPNRWVGPAVNRNSGRRWERPYVASAPGATVFTQAVSAVLSFVGLSPLTLNTTKGVTAGLSFTGPANLLKAITTSLTAATLSFAGVFVKLVKANLTVAGLSFTGAVLAGSVLHQALTAALSFTGAMLRQTNKLVSGGLSFTGPTHLLNGITKGIAGGLSFAGALKNAVSKFITGTLGFNYPGLVLADGAVGYWRLDDSGASAADYTGNGHTGTLSLSGVTTGVTGALDDGDAAMQFDGIAGDVDVSFSSQLNPTPAWSVEGWWFETIGQAANNPILDCRPASSGASAAGFDLFLNVGTGVGVSVCSTNVSQTLLTFSVPNLLNTWHHAVATYDGAQARLYVDGVLRAGPTTCPYTANPTKASAIGHLTGGANFVNAKLDEIAIYPTALSPTAVAAHYAAGVKTLVKSIAKILTASLSFAGDIIKRLNRALTAVLSFTGIQTRTIRKLVASGLSFVGARIAIINKGITASLGFSGLMVRRVAQALSGALSFVGNLVSQGGHTQISLALSATLGFTASISRGRFKTLIANITPTGALSLLRWYVGAFKFLSQGSFRAAYRGIRSIITQNRNLQ